MVDDVKKEMFAISTQFIDLTNVIFEGRILDIGGGGEGVIGQLKGVQVIAIDIRKEELEEAPEGGLKIIMDARELKFLDKAFDTVTSFFAMMYIANNDHKKVFEEVYRVLKPAGEFVIWDVNIPSRNNKEKDIFVVPLEVEIGKKKIVTSYGVQWKNKEQDLGYFSNLCRNVGFEIIDSLAVNETFYLRVRKNKQ